MIAIDVQEEARSSISRQTSSNDAQHACGHGLALWQNREKEADMVIVPDVADIDPLSCEEADTCIKRGREAVMAVAGELKKLVR